jgi:hypothetical protein
VCALVLAVFYIMLKNLFFPLFFHQIDVKQDFEVEIDSSDGQQETAIPACMKIFLLDCIYERKEKCWML